MDSQSFRYDIEGLAKDMEIDLSILSTLYTEYFIEMKNNLDESKALCQSKNYEKLERVIHNIKGISISLNVRDIYLMANKLDLSLKIKNYDNALNDINYINELFNAAETDIKDFFNHKNIKI